MGKRRIIRGQWSVKSVKQNERKMANAKMELEKFHKHRENCFETAFYQINKLPADCFGALDGNCIGRPLSISWASEQIE